MVFNIINLNIMKVTTIVIGVLAVIATAVIATHCARQDINNDIDTLTDAYADTLKQIRNNKGQLESTILVLQTNSQKLLNTLGLKNDEINRLAKLNKEYNERNKKLISALAISNNIIASYKDTIANMVIGDTVVNNIVYQTYTRDFALLNKYDLSDTTLWVKGNIVLGKTRFELDLSVKNQYDVAIYRERKNIFSKYSTYVTMINLNPYDKTNELRVLVTDTPKKKRFAVLAGVGIGMTTLTKFEPILGITVGAKLIEF
jgi:hypothetical protein